MIQLPVIKTLEQFLVLLMHQMTALMENANVLLKVEHNLLMELLSVDLECTLSTAHTIHTVNSHSEKLNKRSHQQSETGLNTTHS